MNALKKINIAVDGYSSCGKSTLAKALAKKINYIFIDSGAMYRCVALFAIENGWVKDRKIEADKLIASLDKIQIQFGTADDKGNRPVLLNEVDVSIPIRSIAVANIVSEIAAIKEVRSFLVRAQQEIGKDGGVIMDGRDIGSVVFPNAELKLFITASPEIRVHRRYNELVAKGEQVSLKIIADNLKHRDLLDTTREESPLIQTADAIVIDNSNLTENDQLELAYDLYKKIAESSRILN